MKYVFIIVVSMIGHLATDHFKQPVSEPRPMEAPADTKFT